jgi:uncharacterized DUF497 family protein
MEDIASILSACVGFEWDEGNKVKNWQKHNVSQFEAEQVFFNVPLVIADDAGHSQKENRYYALGKTDLRRLLFVVFTVRGELIRIISSRDMHKKERQAYETHEKKDTGF